jgi:hypothetical protein
MELELESKKFAVRLLDLCKNTDEAVLLLAIDLKIEHYYEREVGTLLLLLVQLFLPISDRG